MKRGERNHASGAGPASPLEFPRWSPLLSCILSSDSMNHPHLPPVNLSCLISLELTFCYFQWKESCPILRGSCQALPAFGICPCSSSSLDCSLQKFHDSFPLLLQVGLEGHLLSEAPPAVPSELCSRFAILPLSRLTISCTLLNGFLIISLLIQNVGRDV